MGRPKIQQPNCIDCGKEETYCKNRCISCYRKLKRKIRSESSPRKKCDCSPNCLEIIPSIRMDGTTRRFADGHGRGGENHSQWKGGKIELEGYSYIWVPDHPKKNKRGYVAEHRLYFEQYYNCCLLPWIELHHKDGNIKNNFDINNLQPVTKSEHLSITKTKDMSERICLLCGSNETYIDKRGYKRWLRDPITNQEWLCKRCYDFRLSNNGLRTAHIPLNK